MTGHHVREKTNDEGEGLDEHTQELHRYQDELHTQGYTRRVEDMAPVMAVGTEEDHHKRDQTEYRGEGDITRYVR